MKNNERKVSERFAAIALSALLAVSYTPLYAFADNENDNLDQNTIAEDAEQLAPSSETTSFDNPEENNDDPQPEPSNGRNASTEQNTPEVKYSVTSVVLPDELKDVYSFTINGSEETVEVNPDDDVTIQVSPKTSSDSKYRIISFKVGNETIEDAVGKDSYEYSFKFSKDQADENGALNVSVELSQVYVVSFTYDSQNGSVEPNKEFSAINADDPSQTIGTVLLEDSEKLNFTAKPAEHYRVSSVKIDGEEQQFNQNDYIYNSETISDNQNHNVEVMFSLNTYSVTVAVTAEDNDTGTVEIPAGTVDYGGTVDVVLMANEGYYLSEALIDGDTIPASSIVNGKYTINNITSDKVVSVTYKKSAVASVNDFSWNSEEALEFKNNKYNFSAGKAVVFSTDKSGIKLVNSRNETIGGNESQKSVTISGSDPVEISDVELYYSESDYVAPSWHIVHLEQPIAIDFYQGATVTLNLPSLDSPYTCYNSDVVVDLDIKTPEYSGIKEIEYWVGDSTEHTKVDANTRKLVIPSSEYDKKDIVVHVNVTDEQGHTTNAASESFNINTVKPTVGISIDGEKDAAADDGNYNTKRDDGSVRTATVIINDRSYTFNKTIDSSVFQIEKDGNLLSDSEIERMVSWSESGDVLTAKIVFSEDGTYKWGVKYSNRAGLHNEGYSSENDSTDFLFKIDATPATGKITISENPFDTLLSTLTFGYYSADKFKVTISADDSLSSTNIWYYLHNDSEPLNRSALDQITDENWNVYSGAFDLSDDNLYVVYAKIRDDSGNITYICSNGHIIDSGKPQVTIEPRSYSRIDNNTTYVYNEDAKNGIDINVSVTDSEVSSGIKTVSYWVESDRVKTQEETVLYSFENDSPTYSDLLRRWNGTIKVDAVKNDSSNVVVYIKATDNAGCTVTNTVNLDINVTAPTIALAYDNNDDNNGNGSFKAQRTATITFTDRNNHFSQENADDGIVITAKDASGTDIETAIPTHTWTHEGDTHTMTLFFEKDANYTLSINYTNDVENQASEVYTGDSVAPYMFTVDLNKPTGTIQTVQDPWTTLLEVLTFGIFTSEEYDVVATADDETSPTMIKYYISNDTTPLNSEQLDSVVWTDYNDQFSINDPNNYVIYTKVTDAAGNYTYISSDGHIIDTAKPTATITLEPANGNNIYNKDVTATIHVTDDAPYSGIKSIVYWIEADGKVTQEETVLYSFDNTAPAYEELVNKWSDTVVIDSAKNNSSNVILYVKVVDNADLETVASQAMDIDITAPSISVSYDNNADYNGNTYFNASRTATVTITERSNHFSSDDATNGIVITAKDVNGNDVSLPVISNWNTVCGAMPDQDTHTATISYAADANYTFSIAYTDKADNANSDVNTSGSTAPYKFTVDATAPVGTITAASAEGRVNTWDALIGNLSFGFWSNSRINISGTSEDATSPIFPVQYYKYSSTNAADATSALSVSDLNSVSKWSNFETFDVYPNEQFTVYLKITDYAGNITYISTNGLIVDDNAPRDELAAPEINITPEQSESGIYNGDVTVSISVDDPLVGGTYSGLKTIRYYVYNMGQETRQDELYSFSAESPLQNELQKSWNGEITVDSRQNNSNDVIVEVYAEDNAGNSSTERITLKIDVTPPSIIVSYTNNTTQNDLFKAGRTAEITIYERNFSEKYVNLKTTKNGESYIESVAWSSSGGSGNGDDTAWTASVPFNEDGDYTFAINCTDLASNPSGQISFADGTVLGDKFTVDGTVPKISVVFADKDTEPKGSYYKGTRTATITIEEHHFNKESALNGIVITGSNDGTAVEVKPSAWQNGQNSDIYTATAVFEKDADYTITVDYTDEAGNAGTQAKHGFTVDTTKPALSVLVNGKKDFDAYNGSVLPVISYNDVNFDSNQVEISMTGVRVDVATPVISDDKVIFTLEGRSGKKVEWKAHFEDNDAHYGKVLTFDDYPSGTEMDEFDDIYTLKVAVTDKSGLKSEQTSNFSVNRYGSTYDIKSVQKILGSYVHNVSGVVVKEINPNELKNYSVTLFKNNETITLNEGDDFTVKKSGDKLDWHEYEYTINDSIFTDDGTYSLTFHSEDKANNISENTLETKNSNISFGVDNTPPLAVVANVESGKTYNVEKLDAIMTANDNLVLSSVEVKLDGKTLKEWGESQISEINKINNPDDRLFYFEISGESTDAHTLEVICYDAANNPNEQLVIRNFYVTTDNWTIFKNWIKNHIPVVAGSLGGILAIIGVTIYFIMKKRRKAS